MDAERRDTKELERQFRYAAAPHLKETAKPEPTLDLEPPQGPSGPSLGTDDGHQEPEREEDDQLVARVRGMQEALTRTLNRAAKAKEIDLGRGR